MSPLGEAVGEVHELDAVTEMASKGGGGGGGEGYSCVNW